MGVYVKQRSHDRRQANRHIEGGVAVEKRSGSRQQQPQQEEPLGDTVQPRPHRLAAPRRLRIIVPLVVYPFFENLLGTAPREVGRRRGGWNHARGQSPCPQGLANPIELAALPPQVVVAGACRDARRAPVHLHAQPFGQRR